MMMLAGKLAGATEWPIGALVSGVTEGPRTGRIIENIATWMIVAALSAVIGACVAVLTHKTRLRNLETSDKAKAQAIGKLADRLIRIETACPEHRMRLVGKDELVRVHSAINDLANRVGEQIDGLDRHAEQRTAAVHARVNDIQTAVGELTGQMAAMKETGS